MKAPAPPRDEAARLEALRRLEVLDTAPEERFDRLTRLGRALLKAPICLISLVDADRQWFKSRQGIDAPETPRDISFCGHAIQGRRTFLVEDTLEDPRFADNPLVLGEPKIRFYAGRPLATVDGRVVGTFCVIDREPRSMDTDQLEALNELADLAERELQLVEEVKILEEYRAAQEELDRFFAMSVDMLCIGSFDGTFKKVNPAWARTLGYSPEEMYELPFLNLVHPEDLQRTRDEARKLLEGGTLVSFENRYRCKDGGYRWLLWSVASDVQSQRMYAVTRDITELREAQAQTLEALQVAEQASEAKGRLLANMSHELRTPLNSIIGFANILLKEVEGTLSREQLTYLERIRANGVDLLALINHILDLAKAEAGQQDVEQEPIDLGHLVTAVLSRVEVQALEKSLELVAEIPPRLQTLRTDAQKLKQIVTNLVANAIKFTQRGSVRVRIVANENGLPTLLEVVDTGEGIAAEDLERVFEPFQQVDGTLAREHDGTGLGLAISRHLSTLLGYSLTVKSKVNHGTTFTVTFGGGGS